MAKIRKILTSIAQSFTSLQIEVLSPPEFGHFHWVSAADIVKLVKISKAARHRLILFVSLFYVQSSIG